MALDPERPESHNIGQRNRREPRKRIPVTEAVAAVRLIDSGLQSDDNLDPARYDAQRGELVDEDARAWLHGGRLDAVLPTSDQIKAACRNDRDPEGWLTVLSLAGSGRRAGPTQSVAVRQALEWFLQDAGWLPRGRDQLAEYGRAKGFSLRLDATSAVAPEIDVLRAERAELGLWTPPRGPVIGKRPAFEVVPFERAPRASRVLGLTYEDVVDALVWALDEFGGERVLTQDAYQAWCNGRPHAPSMSTVQRVAKKAGKTFADARGDALRKRAAGSSAPPRPETVLLDLYGAGDTAIVVVIEPKRPRGRPRKYRTEEERAAARREQRRRREEREARRREREREREPRRQRGRQARREHLRDAGGRVQYGDLIEAGLISADIELFTVYRGRRYTARFDGGRFHVDGYGEATSLSGAATLIVNGPRDGWDFWRVGEGDGVPVKRVRERLSSLA